MPDSAVDYVRKVCRVARIPKLYFYYSYYNNILYRFTRDKSVNLQEHLGGRKRLFIKSFLLISNICSFIS